jgi:hypothetical protein
MTTEEGPALDALTHRLSECPEDFLLMPRTHSGGVIDVAAVVSDLSRALGGSLLGTDVVARFRNTTNLDRNRLRIVLVASWVLHDEWFRARKRFADAAVTFLLGGFDLLAELVEVERFLDDPDRREELVRLLLQALGLRPAGESEARAADRLATMSSVERNRVINDTREAQARVQQIREAMKKKAAAEAAAAYSRE